LKIGWGIFLNDFGEGRELNLNRIKGKRGVGK